MTQKTSYEEKCKEYIPDQTHQDYRNARRDFKKSAEGLLPDGFVEHQRNGREILLAWRRMIDHLLKKIDKPS